jgi:L-alanine-DL-glutamate epimerase-like enolase superfamily enzyme
MDLGVGQFGPVTTPDGLRQQYGGLRMEHPFMSYEITEKCLAGVTDFVAMVREGLGYEVPLTSDHFGPLSVNSCIRLGRALTKYNISWLEDLIPWQETALLKQIADAIETPVCTGEDIFLKENFEPLCREHAVDIIHVDLPTVGGILETKKTGDMAQGYGVPMALHCAHTPIGAIASAHAAAATENFLCLENHAVDVPYWSDLVDGVEKPIVNKGYITVPDKPGLGITLNEAARKAHLMRGEEWFAPTDQWNNVRSNDGLWS